MVVPNPNWPLLHVEADFTAGPPGTPGINRRSLDKANGLGVHSISTKRGRQYELGQCEAGTATLTVADPKEVLNPGNVNSPFMTGGNTILSRRQLQIWALWNTSTGGIAGNVLNTANRAPGQPDLGASYGYDPSFEAWNTSGTVMSPDGSTASVVSTLPSGPLNSNTGFETGIPPWVVTGGTVVQSGTQKHSGSFAAQLTPSGAAAQVYIESEKVPVAPGNLYCINLWVWATSAVTGNFSATVNWYNASNVFISSSALNVSLTAGTWTNVQNTFTAPAGAASGTVVPTLSGTPAAAQIFYVDDASLTNATNPADGSYTVTKVAANSSTSYVSWVPRITGGGSYTLSVDVYAPTGVTVTAVYGANTTATTVTGAYQTLNLTVTATNTYALQIKATSAPAYPATFYVANVVAQGTMPGWSQTAGSAMRWTQTQAHSGTYSNGTVMAASTDSMSLPIPTAPTITYTMSAWVYAVGAGSVVRMSVGGSTASSSLVGAWQRLTVTFVASDAVTMVSWSTPSGTFPVTAYVDDIQLEAAASAAAYTASGPTAKALHTGYVERWPQTWTMQGSRGVKPLESVDALAVLSRTHINQSYRQTIMADSPYVYMPLNDQSGPQNVLMPNGGQPFLGYQNLGTSGAVNFAGDTFLDGSPAATVVQQNTTPPTSANTAYITYLAGISGLVTMNPASFTIEAWIKVSNGYVYIGAGSLQPGENPFTEPYGPKYQIGWLTSSLATLTIHFADPNGSGVFTYNLGNGGSYGGSPDGQWHHFVLRMVGGGNVSSIVDGVAGGNAPISGTTSTLIPLNFLFVDATTYYGNTTNSAVAVSNLAMYPSILSTAQVQNHYQRGTGYIGELPGARVSRLLTKYWGSNYTAATGSVKLAPDYYWNPVSTSGQSSSMSVLQAIQDIVMTENGLCYANAAGTLVFEDRASRYQNQTSLWTFGENAASGELPYDNIEYDFDPTYVYSQVNLTRPGNTTLAPMVNTTTQANYGQAILSKQLQATTDFDLQQAGIFYLNRYGQQKQRIRKMVFSPGKNPTLFTAALSLEISNRVTVKRRTSAGVTISDDYYVEAIRHHIVAKEGEWAVELELSPVFVKQAWVLGDPVYGVLGSTTIPVY